MILPINERYINELTGIELDAVDVPEELTDEEIEYLDNMPTDIELTDTDIPEEIDDEEADYLDKLRSLAGTELEDVGPIVPLPTEVEAETTSFGESTKYESPVLEGSTLTVSDDDDNYKLFDEAKKKKAAKKKLPIRKDYKKSCGCC